ncbi:MAG TPA: YfhO family protein, partial [bacterium]|nr:YfhO family protein [bacterium]
AGCAVGAWAIRKFSHRFAVFLTLVLIVELSMFGRGFNPESEPERIQILPASTRDLMVHPPESLFRTLPVGKTYPPHLSLRLGMHDIRGNDALTPLVTEDYVALFAPEIRDAHQLPALRMMWLNQWSSPLVDALNVKYVAIPVTDIDTVPPDLIPYKTAGGVHLFTNPGCFMRAFVVTAWEYRADDAAVLTALADPDIALDTMAIVTGTGKPHQSDAAGSRSDVRIVKYDLHTIAIDVSVENESMLVLSDTFYPGWNAYIDNQPVECLQVNHMMRGVRISEGTHLAEFRFEPLSWRLGMFLTLLGLLLIPLSLFSVKPNNRMEVSQ